MSGKAHQGTCTPYMLGFTGRPSVVGGSSFRELAPSTGSFAASSEVPPCAVGAPRGSLEGSPQAVHPTVRQRSQPWTRGLCCIVAARLRLSETLDATTPVGPWRGQFGLLLFGTMTEMSTSDNRRLQLWKYGHQPCLAGKVTRRFEHPVFPLTPCGPWTAGQRISGRHQCYLLWSSPGHCALARPCVPCTKPRPSPAQPWAKRPEITGGNMGK